MTAEQRVWIASILSAVVLISYANVMSRSASQSQITSHQIDSNAAMQAQKMTAEIQPLDSGEETFTLESDRIRLELGKRTGMIRSVVLKRFQNMKDNTSLEFGRNLGVLSASFGEEKIAWILKEQGARRAVWSADWKNGLLYERIIELDEALPTITVSLQSENRSSQQQSVPIKILATWHRGDEINGRYNLLEASMRTKKTSPWQRTSLVYHEGMRETKDVPRGTSIVTLSERFFCQSIKLDQNQTNQVSVLATERGRIATAIESSLVSEPGSAAMYTASVYFGPRDFFALRDAGFEQAFSLGMLARIGLIMVLLLKLIASITHSYGAAIILLAALVTSALSPFTMIGFRSMKKMQELQPRMDQIKKKYEKDQQRMNQEIFALFREHRVSPLSGCLPMMLQLPVFFALWSAISHVIELRGERFLWIKDLSLPDHLTTLPLGLSLNILPILMAVSMFVQAKMSQPSVKTAGSNPFSGPMMSVIFGIMFYQVPAGLVLYWLTNSLSSMAWYRLVKS